MSPDPNAFYAGGLAVESYDLFAGSGRLQGDLDFYLELAREAAGRILELGCGGGRILLPLAEAGLTATGVDVSAPMLAVAERRLAAASSEVRARTRLVCAPMQAPGLEGPFGLILIPARAFQHVVEPAEQRATLEWAHAALAPRGRLVIDLFDPLLEAVTGSPAPGPAREAVDPGSGRRFRRTSLQRWTDPVRQLVGERLSVELLDAAGGVVAAEETSWALRWSTRQEMAWLLELCGFEVEALYSDFRRSPPAYAAEQVWVARRR